MQDKARKLQGGAWGLSTLAGIVAIVAWGAGIRWNIGRLSAYQIFPVFGLMAFSLMWAHYITAAVRAYLKLPKEALKSYFEITSLFVLLCLIVHPGLLIFQLWHDGFGLPPFSYLNNYVAKKNTVAALLGSIGLVIFLAFELHRWFSEKSWWKYVQYASDIGMGLIFIHALKLGRQLQPGWFRVVWWIYGISLLGALVYIYTDKNNLIGGEKHAEK